MIVVSQTDAALAGSVASYETLLRQLAVLADLCPPLTTHGYVERLRNLEPGQIAVPADLIPAIHADWSRLSRLMADTASHLLPVAHLLPQLAEGAPYRAICVPESCPSGPTQSQIDDILIAAAAAQLPATTAQGIADAIPEPYNAAAVAVATALTLVVDTLNLTAAILQKEVNAIAACEEAAFQQVVYSMCGTINVIKASLDYLHDKVDLLDVKVNSLLNLAAELQALTREIMLRDMEENLQNCQYLTTLYLPAAAKGRLETVQTLLLTLVETSKTAGLDTGAAESFRRQGILAAAAGDYCRALHWFSLAYRELTRLACCAGT